MPRYATEANAPTPAKESEMKVNVTPDVQECFSKDFKSVKKKFADLLKKKMEDGGGKLPDLSMAVGELARLDKMEMRGGDGYMY